MAKYRKLLTAAFALMLGGLAGKAFAQDTTAEQLADLKANLDMLWVLVAAFLVFWMQAGFAYVEGGLTRAKNANNIMMKNLMDFSIGTFAYWAVGFAIMFGDGNGFMGLSGWFLMGADNSPKVDDLYQGVYGAISWTGVPLYAKFIFQLVFAATAATIVSGAMAERTKFTSYIIYSAVITAFIYPVVGHWIWGGGWLASFGPTGFWDFAGSTVVHSTGAWMALVGAWFLGPRIGKYRRDGKSNAIPGHSMPMAALGVFILWLGWFGFNAGSVMAVDFSVAHIAVVTNVAAAFGAILAMVTSWVVFKKPDISMTLNGALAGLVAITAPCAWVYPGSAAIIGSVAGVLVVLSVIFFDRIHLDDPVGAISVHGVCGAFGTIALGLFAQGTPDDTGLGLFFGGGTGLLISQTVGVVSVFAFTVVCGILLFGVLRATIGLRVSAEEELEGLDIGEHGNSAYPDFEMSESHSAGFAGAKGNISS